MATLDTGGLELRFFALLHEHKRVQQEKLDLRNSIESANYIAEKVTLLGQKSQRLII